MKELVFQLPESFTGKTREELLALLDKEVDDFSHYMATLGDWRAVGPLSLQERALIKTYLVQKLTGKIDGGK